MSYQLPDLLTFLTSVSHPSSDGDLHINPSYTPNLSPQSPTLLHLLHRTSTTKSNKLQKTPKELMREYNPGLLAGVYLPFTSIVKVGCESEEVMRVVWEWLGICVLVGEETVRPGRIVGVEEEDDIHGCLEDIAKRLSKISYTSNNQTTADYISSILNASNNPPSKPPHSTNNNHITQYLNWRIDLSGHRVLSRLFLQQHQYNRAIDLALQIIVCVTDLFAYNIHQAWHTTTATTTTDSTRNHLNLISFLLHCGDGSGGDSEIMTLQAAVNITGEMIRQRMVQLQTELYQTRNKEEGGGGKSGGILGNIFSSLFTTKDSFSSTDSDNKTETPGSNDDKTEEIRKTIWNWVTGIIHWAYEVEYFSPDLEEDVDEGGGKKKKKKGGEIRDYGWVFLISKEML